MRPYISVLLPIRPGPPRVRRRRSTRPEFASSACVLLILLLIATGCGPQDSEGGGRRGLVDSATGESSGDESSGEGAEAPPVVVETVNPRRGTVRDLLSVSGDLETDARVDLPSRVSGIVVEVVAREGVRVEEGAVVLRLDDDEARLVVREREAELSDATERAAVARLGASEAENRVATTDVSLERARREYQRIESILDEDRSNPLTQEEIEAKQFALREAELARAAAVLARDRAKLEVDLAELQVVRAEVAKAKAELDLERTRVKSPIAGVVSDLELRVGEYVAAASRVASVVGERGLFTELRVPQRRLDDVRVGQPVEVIPESHPDRTFRGVVETVLPTVDPDQGTVEIRVSVEDPENVLKPGLFVTARIELRRFDSALLVPKRCRVFDGDREYLFVVREGRAHRVAIRSGLENLEEFQVVGDEVIADHDSIVVRGQNQLSDGSRVRVPGASGSTRETGDADRTADRSDTGRERAGPAESGESGGSHSRGDRDA